MATAVGELYGVRDAIEADTPTGVFGSLTPDVISSVCVFYMQYSTSGVNISCGLRRPPAVISGGVVSLNRNANELWTCAVNGSIGVDYAPPGCVVQ